MFKHVDRDDAIERPVGQRYTLLDAPAKHVRRRKQELKAVAEFFTELQDVVVLCSQILKRQVCADTGSDLERARARWSAELGDIALVECLDESIAARQCFMPRQHERLAVTLLVVC